VLGSAFGVAGGVMGAIAPYGGGGSLLSGLGGLFGGAVGLLHLLGTGGLLSATQGAERLECYWCRCHRWIRNCCYAGLPGRCSSAGGAAYLGMHADDKITAGMSKSDIYKKLRTVINKSCNASNSLGQIANAAKWEKGLNKLTSIFGGASDSATGGAVEIYQSYRN